MLRGNAADHADPVDPLEPLRPVERGALGSEVIEEFVRIAQELTMKERLRLPAGL